MKSVQERMAEAIEDTNRSEREYALFRACYQALGHLNIWYEDKNDEEIDLAAELLQQTLDEWGGGK